MSELGQASLKPALPDKAPRAHHVRPDLHPHASVQRTVAEPCSAWANPGEVLRRTMM
jgi:hypothetical protein